MSAFHSGTDDADEANFDGVHITVGKLDSVPEYSCSIVVQGVRRKCDPSDLIDGMAPADSVPEAWLAAIKLPRPVGLRGEYAAQAAALYEQYFRGELTEPVYKLQLGKIEADEKNCFTPGCADLSPHRRDTGFSPRPFGGGKRNKKLRK